MEIVVCSEYSGALCTQTSETKANYDAPAVVEYLSKEQSSTTRELDLHILPVFQIRCSIIK